MVQVQVMLNYRYPFPGYHGLPGVGASIHTMSPSWLPFPWFVYFETNHCISWKLRLGDPIYIKNKNSFSVVFLTMSSLLEIETTCPTSKHPSCLLLTTLQGKKQTLGFFRDFQGLENERLYQGWGSGFGQIYPDSTGSELVFWIYGTSDTKSMNTKKKALKLSKIFML